MSPRRRLLLRVGGFAKSHKIVLASVASKAIFASARAGSAAKSRSAQKGSLEHDSSSGAVVEHGVQTTLETQHEAVTEVEAQTGVDVDHREDGR